MFKVNTKTTLMTNDLNFKNDLNWATNMPFLWFYERYPCTEQGIKMEKFCETNPVSSLFC